MNISTEMQVLNRMRRTLNSADSCNSALRKIFTHPFMLIILFIVSFVTIHQIKILLKLLTDYLFRIVTLIVNMNRT